jgi:hypothetical protein
LQRTPPASSCHINPRKQQTTSQLGCTSPLPRCNGFPGNDAIRCCRCRVLSSHLYSCSSSSGSRSMQPNVQGAMRAKTPQSRAKYLADPPSSLSPLLSPLPSAVYLAIAAIVSGRLGRAQDGGICCGTRAAAFFLSLSHQQSFKQRSVASSVWRALVATQFSSPRKDPGPSDGPQS